MYKTSKEHAQQKRDIDKSRLLKYEDMISSKKCRTWSATMPAFCYTELCPDPRYREPLYKRNRRKGGLHEPSAEKEKPEAE